MINFLRTLLRPRRLQYVGQGRDNLYHIDRKISDRVGRLVGVKTPKTENSLDHLGERFRKMRLSHLLIERSKRDGHLASWIRSIDALGSIQRSEKRGKVYVDHAQGESLQYLLSGAHSSVWTYWENIIKDITRSLEAYGISARDFHLKNIVLGKETGKNLRKHGFFLRDSDEVYINIDPDFWIFDEEKIAAILGDNYFGPVTGSL